MSTYLPGVGETPQQNEQEQPQVGNFDFNVQGKEDIINALKWLKDQVYQEARPFRDQKIRMWRRNESFWLNIQRALWSSSTKGFVQSSEFVNFPDTEEIDVAIYERIVNIYRAHGESFIAALSASLPNPVFSPEDADNPDDVQTAKGYKKLAELVSIRNEAVTKFIKMLYHLYNHGVAFNYSVYHRDKKFGIIKNPVIDYKDVSRDVTSCPECNAEMGGLDSPGMGALQQSSEPFMQGQGTPQCDQCGYQGQGIPTQQTEQIPFIKSYDETPKGNSTIEIFGPLHVTVPYNIRTLEFAGYIRLDTDLDEGLIKELYPGIKLNSGGVDSQDKYNRIPTNDKYTENTSDYAVCRIWFRPWLFNRLNDDLAGLLKAEFPDGVYAVFVGDEFAEAQRESLDAVWTSTEFPTSERIHAEPLGNVIIPIQEMTNDLVSLTMETIESGIAINFFDAQVLDREEFTKHVTNPGDFIPARAKAGQSLEGSFASTKPAVLSREVEPFAASLEQSAQFVLGTFPSIYGGSQEGGSKTLGELRDSKAQAMQRLSIPWVASSMSWVKTLKRSCDLLVNNMIEGEDFKSVQKLGNSFINIWVKDSELKGKIGNVSVESSEQIPISWNQKRAMIMDLMGQNNQMFMSWLSHPENISVLARVIGLADLYVPGDRDRDKQLREIFELIKGEPLPSPAMMQPQMDPNGQPLPPPPPPQSSVPIDPQIDNSQVHIEVLKAFMIGDVGADIKQNNPGGWANLLAHLAEHEGFVQQQQMQQQQQQMMQQNGPPGGPPKPPGPQGNN